MQRIKIQRQGGQLIFNPSTQMVDRVTDGGSFIFENDDPQHAHQPQPDNTASTWVDQPIASGQPSTLITANSNGSFPYHCELHPTEKGVVVAPNVITVQTEMINTGFNPSSQPLSPPADGGLFVFLNLDQSTSHQPQPDDSSQGTWFPQPIPPGAYSPVKSLSKPGNYSYHCAIHPGETGAINIPQPKPAT